MKIKGTSFGEQYQLVYIIHNIYIHFYRLTCSNYLSGLFVGQHFAGMIRELLCQGDSQLNMYIYIYIWKLNHVQHPSTSNLLEMSGEVDPPLRTRVQVQESPN